MFVTRRVFLTGRMLVPGRSLVRDGSGFEKSFLERE
jgi:hypothetical protein